MDKLVDLLVGVVFSSAIAVIAYKKQSLSLSGAIAAVILGTGIYFFGGIISSALMVGFFISSSLLSKVNGKSKGAVDRINNKGSRRDYIQVFANGGIGLILSILYYFSGNIIFLVGVAVSFAEANSDTWASEIGVLSKKKPISIITFSTIENGLSGGVSILGTVAAFCGASFIAGVFMVMSILKFGIDYICFYIIASMLIAFLGFFGSIVDSLLGAIVQALYYDEANNKITEKKYTHGKINRLVKGVDFINNDMVNILSNIITVAIFLILGSMIFFQ